MERYPPADIYETDSDDPCLFKNFKRKMEGQCVLKHFEVRLGVLMRPFLSAKPKARPGE
jgi:hypothetical protein